MTESPPLIGCRHVAQIGCSMVIVTSPSYIAARPVLWRRDHDAGAVAVIERSTVWRSEVGSTLRSASMGSRPNARMTL